MPRFNKLQRKSRKACECAEPRLANGCSYAKWLVWPAMTVFLSKRLLLLAQGAWWDICTGQTRLVPRHTSGCHFIPLRNKMAVRSGSGNETKARLPPNG